MMLVDPSYAKNWSPLVASVSEHQPSRWTTFFQDVNTLLFFVPLGFYYCLVHKITHGKLFIGMYGVFAVYFASAMTRLMLVFVPCACIMSAIAMSQIIRAATKSLRLSVVGKSEENEEDKKVEPHKDGGENEGENGSPEGTEPATIK